MEAIDCIRGRQSIRKFKEEQVPRVILQEVFEAAGWSPSYKNSQPWEAVVVSGEKKEKLSSHLISQLEAGKEKCPDLAEPASWPSAEQGRIDDLFRKRKEAMGIDLADPRVIFQARRANFNFYGAPHAIYLFQDSSLSQWSLFDLGLFAQSLMLAAHAKGLGTVPQAFATDYADDVKSLLGIPGGKRLVLGISIGYPDMDSPVNSLRTDRVAMDEIVSFLD